MWDIIGSNDFRSVTPSVDKAWKGVNGKPVAVLLCIEHELCEVCRLDHLEDYPNQKNLQKSHDVGLDSAS